mmetsp:Transcript_103076/g.298125  ORF Transcript_103076/g.298125 Transcript_103076/m.298125 type:complete len:300 (+) Transcript_103076:871-1770(+)
MSLVAHLRDPPPQGMADEERRQQTVPDLAQGDQHEQRDHRLRQDQQHVELHGRGRRLPGLHRVFVVPVDARPDALRHDRLAQGGVRSLLGNGARCVRLARLRQQLLVTALPLLVRLLLFTLMERASVGPVLRNRHVRRARRWGGCRRLGSLGPPRRVVCGGLRCGRRLGLRQPRPRHCRFAKGHQADGGEKQTVQQRRQRSDDHRRHQGDRSPDHPHAPKIHEELLQDPVNERQPQNGKQRVDEPALESKQVPCHALGDIQVVIDAQAAQCAADLGEEGHNGHLQLALVALDLLLLTQF